MLPRRIEPILQSRNRASAPCTRRQRCVYEVPNRAFRPAGARMVDKDNAITCVRSSGCGAPVPADSRLSPTQASASALAAGVRPSRAAGYWLCLLLAVPTAGFLVRLFMIQHDCGHGSFFRHRLANDWLGRAIGVLTLTPYDFWRRDHAIHHATSGNLERRGIGDINTLTVGEYTAMSTCGRLRYRPYRHPLVMF